MSFVFNEMKACIEIAEGLISHIIRLTEEYDPEGIKTGWRNEPWPYGYKKHYATILTRVDGDLDKFLENSNIDRSIWAEQYIRHLDLVQKYVLANMTA